MAPKTRRREAIAQGDIPPPLRIRFWQAPRLVWIVARAYLPLPVALTSLPVVLFIGLFGLALGGRVIAAPGTVLTVQPWPRPRRPVRLVALSLAILVVVAALESLLPVWGAVLVCAVCFIPLTLTVLRRQQIRQVEKAAQGVAKRFAAVGCRVVIAENLAAWPRGTGRGFALAHEAVAVLDSSHRCTVASAGDERLVRRYCHELGFERVGGDESRVLARHSGECSRGSSPIGQDSAGLTG